jgi:hypothetical protein
MPRGARQSCWKRFGVDDDLLEKYLDGKELSTEGEKALREARVRKTFSILYGSATARSASRNTGRGADCRHPQKSEMEGNNQSPAKSAASRPVSALLGLHIKTISDPSWKTLGDARRFRRSPRI